MEELVVASPRRVASIVSGAGAPVGGAVATEETLTERSERLDRERVAAQKDLCETWRTRPDEGSLYAARGKSLDLLRSLRRLITVLLKMPKLKRRELHEKISGLSSPEPVVPAELQDLAVSAETRTRVIFFMPEADTFHNLGKAMQESATLEITARDDGSFELRQRPARSRIKDTAGYKLAVTRLLLLLRIHTPDVAQRMDTMFAGILADLDASHKLTADDRTALVQAAVLVGQEPLHVMSHMVDSILDPTDGGTFGFTDFRDSDVRSRLANERVFRNWLAVTKRYGQLVTKLTTVRLAALESRAPTPDSFPTRAVSTSTPNTSTSSPVRVSDGVMRTPPTLGAPSTSPPPHAVGEVQSSASSTPRAAAGSLASPTLEAPSASSPFRESKSVLTSPSQGASSTSSTPRAEAGSLASPTLGSPSISSPFRESKSVRTSPSQGASSTPSPARSAGGVRTPPALGASPTSSPLGAARRALREMSTALRPLPVALRTQVDRALSQCAAAPADWLPSRLRDAFMPVIEPRFFASALARAETFAPATAPPSFNSVALFNLMCGSDTIHGAEARDLFELLFVSQNRFPVLYTGIRDVDPVICPNPRRLVVPEGLEPGVVRPPRTMSGRDKLLEVFCTEVAKKRLHGPFTEDQLKALAPGVVINSSFVLDYGVKPSPPGMPQRRKERHVLNASSRLKSVNADITDPYIINLDHSKKFVDRYRQLRKAFPDAEFGGVTADISECYRTMGIREADFPLYGMSVVVDEPRLIPCYDGKTLSIDICTYIDDFFVFGRYCGIDDAIAILRTMLKSIGMDENQAKLDSPSSGGEYLGVVYDFKTGTKSLPAKKKKKYIAHIDHLLQRHGNRLKRSALQSIVGRLVHAACVFDAGTIFYQRLLASLRASHGKQWATLSEPERDDLRWWRSLLATHSGTVVIGDTDWESPDVHRIYTDASSRTGYGAIFEGRYFYGTWDKDIQKLIDAGAISINELELVVLNFVLETWGHLLEGRRLLLRCDNQACVNNVTGWKTQSPVRAALLRRLYVVAALHGIEVASTYINTSPRTSTRTLYLAPRLEATALLLQPDGPANPTNPAWSLTYALTPHISRKRYRTTESDTPHGE
eukprot:g3040.t1